MFFETRETRSESAPGRYYIVHTPDGHLAHIEREGQQVAAFFDNKAAADAHTRRLNEEEYGHLRKSTP
ncbi:hypothetical protein [Streptomyces sp. NPDC003077]|uniref:hypothetical protein n=1 Tax=Streptomyces sp. NPDC003077 TaxID=3154443 RepID=UPI0033A43464